MEMSVGLVSKWPICSVLDKATVTSIKKIYVFGSSGDQVIYVTKDDDVFAMGANANGCLGLGDTVSRDKPNKIEALCKKQIKDVTFGAEGHMLAVTANKTVFSWGTNTHGQLGNGNTNAVLSPIQVDGLKGVVQVATGNHHSLARTDGGEIFVWGTILSNQPLPTKVEIGKAAHIACGSTYCMALLCNGEVHGWGHNANGELGLGNATNQPLPCKVPIEDGVIITQIVCGAFYTLALSDEGHLYSWGVNSYGQLGTGTKNGSLSPFRIKVEDRFTEIGASSCLSAGLTDTGKVFVWGLCREQHITVPFPTGLSTINDAFIMFQTTQMTWQMYSTDDNPDRTITGDISKSFDDSTTTDVAFIAEGKPIHCHKTILRLRCDHFRSMFQSHWDDDKKNCIEVPHPYHVYRAFLYFLYTDSVDLCPEGALGLLELANSYCEKVLKCKCEQIIKQAITIENAAMLYAAAIKFSANDLEKFCFKFAEDNMTHVTQSEAFAQLDESMLRRFILKASQAGAFKT